MNLINSLNAKFKRYPSTWTKSIETLYPYLLKMQIEKFLQINAGEIRARVARKCSDWVGAFNKVVICDTL